MTDKNNSRLVEIDALRGIAAVAVVLFHYTTRYTELFTPSSSPSFFFSDGHLGVNLFFIISGFVIFMTLEKTSKPMDFVVSRFSRLFPTYWAAIILTFTITHILGLPGKLVDIATATGNLIMLHGLFHIPHVDGVYWTLEVELLFYCGMLLLFRLRSLHLVHYALFALMALRLAYHVLATEFNIDLPWTISRLLILKYIPWFAIGISIYQASSRRCQGRWLGPAFTVACAISSLWIEDSWVMAILAGFLGSIVFLAASGYATLLRNRILVWLGVISYPLYLLHENIGWSVILKLSKFGIPTDWAILIAIAFSLAMATALNRLVEVPAMKIIRATYRKRQIVAT